MKPVNALLAGLLVLTQYALWFGDKNVFDLYRLTQASGAQLEENQEHAKRNQVLAAQVIDLKSGGESVETLAREELGLIREGETFYQIIE